ncbi:MAG: prolyl oligopeptidase family serine peptidase [Candidatus Neomarinimicrobiota bacterium]|nr:prolyl oligopeptidase family serine peptidase [Candidatus Neomarinimicrobiota bacterium]
MLNRLLTASMFLSIFSVLLADRPYDLTVAKIMQDPKWIGISPSNIHWSEDSRWIYFNWNPEGAESDSLYKLPPKGGEPKKVSPKERLALPARYGDYTKNFMEKVYSKNGDIFLLDIKNESTTQITHTVRRETNPTFSGDEKSITYLAGGNLYRWQIATGNTIQLTDFRKKDEKSEKEPNTEHERWLKQEELKLITVLNERKTKLDKREDILENEKPQRALQIVHGEKDIQNIQSSPDGKFVTFRLYKSAKHAERTIVPSYVTDTGFTTDLNAREKVGRPDGEYELGVYNIAADTIIYVNTDSLSGIFESPQFTHDSDSDKPTKRKVYFSGPIWSHNGKRAALILQSLDNKDRWIVALDPLTAEIKLLDHQHDEAWIGGPGIRWWRGAVSTGWTPDNKSFWFQSEETGYSHLYTVDTATGAKKQLTSGDFEVRDVRISRDKKWWYFRSNEVHPGELHLYRMPIGGSKWEQITSMTGNNGVTFSPDEKTLAIRHSYSNRPWDLFVMKNRPGAKATRLTTSQSNEWSSYPWRDPEIITFKAEDDAEVSARLYRPKNPQNSGPAVIFVHGAGYLQNVHKWWSSYFREYMFHNLLADNGYTVLDIDYRGSAGYGRDWRTAIYRHMGGKDLSDQVDGAKLLVNKYGVDPGKIGIYGGSYGGFIALMAMFTEPDVFAAGGSLRPVTDWAHYNHPYTSNILNIPQADSLAYVRSSPIYHAEGLEGALLICHGMIDTNVHFQDVVRLSQRLIELGKENWEVAIYPLEGHGFREPSSWTDEYRRIFKLFETHLR